MESELLKRDGFMVEENLAMGSIWGVVLVSHWWFEIRVSLKDAAELSRLYWTIRSAHAVCWGGVLVWLKSRLMERGYCRGLAVRQDEDVSKLIFRQPHKSETVSVPPAATIHLGYARSGISRSILSVITPIDRVAAAVTDRWRDSRCQFCGLYFRNPNACRLHVLDSHPEEVLRWGES